MGFKHHPHKIKLFEHWERNAAEAFLLAAHYKINFCNMKKYDTPSNATR